MSLVLAGDVGGTKTEVALFAAGPEGWTEVRSAVYPSREYAALEEVLGRFLGAAAPPPLAAACFGVAGPVVDGRSRITNLPWQIEEGALARAAGTARVKLLNDLEAAAYGMLGLDAEKLVELNPAASGAGATSSAPAQHRGNIAVIAAGTGLGQAQLFWDGRQHHPSASEGGHADFAPRTEIEVDLLRWLRARIGGRVSWERVLSGPGIHSIYLFLRDSGLAPEPAWLAERLAAGDPAATIGQLGLEGSEPLTRRTVELFAEVYGAEAGNMALRAFATGGVLIGGGIAPKLLPVLRAGGFLRAFCDKGRFEPFLRGLPVRVALDPRVPLLGAARYAERLAAG